MGLEDQLKFILEKAEGVWEDDPTWVKKARMGREINKNIKIYVHFLPSREPQGKGGLVKKKKKKVSSYVLILIYKAGI